jgi:hypothetical protein
MIDMKCPACGTSFPRDAKLSFTTDLSGDGHRRIASNE